MIAIVIALIVFVLSGFGLGYWLQRNSAARQASQPQPRGADQLAKLHWREFAKLVLQAMHARGFDPVIEDGMPADGIPTNGNDILLERDGERALLASKYGTASLVGASALLGLAKSATLRGAARVIVVTPGRFDEEAARLALPVVLVARSTLGTINHTLLSLRALHARGLPVLGVVMNGPPSPGNREALERFGPARVIAEIPPLARVDAAAVAAVAAGIPALDALMRGDPARDARPDA